MNDTAPAVESRLVALYRARSGSDRVRMACEMFGTARALMIADIRTRHPGISDAELRVRIFERTYGDDFDPATCARIVKCLRGFRRAMRREGSARPGVHEILSLLGAGGMGAVYRARDTKHNRDVALKVLLPEVANDAERLARFRREAQRLAALNRPHIANIYELEESPSALQPFESLRVVPSNVEGRQARVAPSKVEGRHAQCKDLFLRS